MSDGIRTHFQFITTGKWFSKNHFGEVTTGVLWEKWFGVVNIKIDFYGLIFSLLPNRLALYFRTYEKYKFDKISKFSKVVRFFNFIYLFDRVFGKSRQKISTRTHAFSILLKWERYHLLHNCVHIGRSQTITAIIRELSKFLPENAS